MHTRPDGRTSLRTAAASLALLLAHAASAAEPLPCPEAATPVLPAHTALALPHSALLLGSSSIEWGFGPALEEELTALGVAKIVRDGRMSTGLSRLDFFDWLAHARTLATAHQPDLVIIQLGGNDAQHLRDPSGRRVADWDTEGWAPTYRTRLAELAGAFRDATVVFVGIPHPELGEYARKMCAVNGLLHQVASREQAWFVPLWDVTTTPEGLPLERFADGDRTHAVRRDDGIHLGKWGAPWAAAIVARRLADHLDLEATCSPDAHDERCEVSTDPTADAPPVSDVSAG